MSDTHPLSTTAPSAFSPTSDAEDDTKRRLRKACSTCRQLKMKCIPSDGDYLSAAPCARCKRRKLNCEYTSHKRTRLTTAERSTDAFSEPSIRKHSDLDHKQSRMKSGQSMLGPPHGPDPTADLYAAEPTRPHDPALWDGQQWGASVSEPITAAHTTLPADLSGANLAASNASVQTNATHLTSPGVLDTALTPASPTSMTRHLEPNVGVIDSRPPTPRFQKIQQMSHSYPVHETATGSGRYAQSTADSHHPEESWNDPVTLGLLTEMEGKFLCHFFLTRMCEISHIFDQVYHTYARLRSSSELFSAVLGVAARFRRPDLVEQLLEHADRLIMRAICRGRASLALVQALLVLVHWKHPDDRSAYMKVGMAFRAACQLRLGATIGESLPAAEMDARARLAGERTWLTLFGYEMAYSDLFRLPALMNSTMRPPAEEVQAWLSRHRHLDIPGDLHLTISYTIIGVLHGSGLNLYNERKGSSDVTAGLEPALNAAYAKWLDDPRHVGVQRCITLFTKSWMLVNVRYRAVLDTSDALSKARLLSALDTCHRLGMELAQTGQLPFLSDASIVAFVLPGYMLFELRHFFSQEELEHVKSILVGFENVATECNDTYPGHALTRMARTYRRLLRAFNRLEDHPLDLPTFPQLWLPGNTSSAYNNLFPPQSAAPTDGDFWTLLSDSFPAFAPLPPEITYPEPGDSGIEGLWMI